jgi:hypothetical protein
MKIDIRKHNPIVYILRYLTIIPFSFIIWLVCSLIILFTGTCFGKHKVTRFKVWRIRKLTALKLWFFHNFRWLCEWLDIADYLNWIDKKFNKNRIE